MTSSTAPSSSALAPRSAGFGASVLGVEDAQQLARLSLQATSNLHAQIALWQRRGLDWPQIYLEGITEAARVLGRWWLCDEIDFASVTVGSSRLHRLLYDLSPQFLAGSQAPLGTTALLLAEPESQHTMGLFMLSEFFKRAGWYTLVEQPRSDANVLRLLSSHWVDVLALSVSTQRQWPALKALVRQARQLSPNPRMVIIAGGPMAMEHAGLLQELGVDWVGEDAASTVERATLGVGPLTPQN